MSVTSTPRTPQSSAGKAREPAGAGGRTPEEELVHRMAACPAGPDREALREAAITAYLPVARRIARRYGSPDRSREDLDQVACLGLVKAVDRFDPGLGHAFLSYAVPTIDGELKRFLRDFTWQVHVPRRLQDKHRRVRLAQEELNRAGRSDGGTVRDIQRLTGIDDTPQGPERHQVGDQFEPRVVPADGLREGEALPGAALLVHGQGVARPVRPQGRPHVRRHLEPT